MIKTKTQLCWLALFSDVESLGLIFRQGHAFEVRGIPGFLVRSSSFICTFSSVVSSFPSGLVSVLFSSELLTANKIMADWCRGPILSRAISSLQPKYTDTISYRLIYNVKRCLSSWSYLKDQKVHSDFVLSVCLALQNNQQIAEGFPCGPCNANEFRI